MVCGETETSESDSIEVFDDMTVWTDTGTTTWIRVTCQGQRHGFL